MRLLYAVLLLVFMGGAAVADRVALVMGNGNYAHANPLRNAANDAADMATALRGLGFQVFEGIDLTRRDALILVQDFAQRLNKNDTALFFFAGHATQLGIDNFIMPVDARPGTEAELIDSSIRMQSILASLENRAGTRIVILDACRDNPFLLKAGSSRSVDSDRGLFKMDAGIGSFIAYSTEPGNVAADGAGRNSPFTEALLRHITSPDQDIHAIMRNVRADVIRTSNNRQVPWENSALVDEVFLTAAPAGQSNAQVPALPRPKGFGEDCVPMNLLGETASLCASSVLPTQSGNSYRGTNLLDNDPATAWVEGEPDTGIGQYLAVDFDRPRSVTAIDFLNGYAKSERLFYRNARVRSLRVTGSNGAEVEIVLKDDSNWQRVQVSGFQNVSWIRLQVDSVYPGSHYTDTAISEMRIH